MRPLVTTLFAVCLPLLAEPVAAQGFRWPEEPKNIQVLPAEAKGQVLGQIMRGYTRALGVRCEFCHVGQGGNLAEFDFPADDKPAKEKARIMYEMVQAINTTHLDKLTELGVPASSRVEVTCVTCHRGNARPVMLGDVLAATIDSAGVDQAVTQYRQLRERSYGGFTWDFSTRTLAELSQRLAGEGKSAAALRMAQLALEVNGESVQGFLALATAQARAGNRAEAIAAFERAEAMAPEQQKGFIRQQIERLRQQP